MKKGFTLLELSIVLVIIGLIIGGVTVGQDLIRSAELNAVVSDFQKHQTAVNSFKLKYNSLPGDMDNAQAYWGAAHATPATCVTTASTGTETCDGDGDGIIDISTGSNEYFRFWQHLANAEIISGQFSGVAGADADSSLIGTNVPESRLTGTGWSVLGEAGAFAGDASRYAMAYRNFFVFGMEGTNEPTHAAALSPPDAAGIDEKIDDGHPAQGTIIARFWNDACSAADDGTHTNSDLVASYKLSDTSVQCALYFRNLF